MGERELGMYRPTSERGGWTAGGVNTEILRIGSSQIATSPRRIR